MQSIEEVPCFDCGEPADPNILGYYEICAKCYNLHLQQLKVYKNNRTTFYPEIDQILPNLFLGNQDAARDQKLLESHKIGAILVCGSHLESPFQKDIVYKKFLIADDPKQKIIDLFPEAYEWIELHLQSGKNVLIHCAAGISRSASFTIAYIMKKNKIKMQQALNFVKQKRPVIYPNSGFLSTLELYEKKLFESN